MKWRALERASVCDISMEMYLNFIPHCVTCDCLQIATFYRVRKYPLLVTKVRNIVICRHAINTRRAVNVIVLWW